MAWPSAPARYSSLVALRRTLPLEVLGTAPGGTRATASGGMPTASATRSRDLGRDPLASRRVLDARVSAATTRRSVPCSSLVTPKATTHPLRTPGAWVAASSISCGTRLRPGLDDQVLAPARDEELAVGAVGEVAAVQKAARAA